MTSFRVASFNLYHFAEADVWWYEHASAAPETTRPCFSVAEWAAKTSWISSVLAEINADVVGFQEVVSVEALRLICAALGYAHFATIAEPRLVEIDGATVYRRPVQAVASRIPFSAEAAQAPAGFAAAFGLAEGWGFRRPPVLARLQPPGFGPVALFCCHLKSPGVSVDDVAMVGEEGLDMVRRTVQGLSRAHAFATMQRVLEASALRHLACAEIDRGAAVGTPPHVMVIGDLNDTPDSPALRALTADIPSERDGGAAKSGDISNSSHILRDAFRLSARELGSDLRPPTHRSGAAGEAIDFILTSAGGQDDPVTVAAHQVWSQHFIAGDPRTTSDHAPVSADFRALS